MKYSASIKADSKKVTIHRDLTNREMEILKYIVLGYSAKKTALKIGISFRTVENHVENLKIKMQCYLKSELIEKALKLGLVNLSELQTDTITSSLK